MFISDIGLQFSFLCGGGGMNWAIGIDMYTLMCIKLMTNKNLLYKTILLIEREVEINAFKGSEEIE